MMLDHVGKGERSREIRGMEQHHPIINLIYFSLVIGCSMIFLHPVCLLISITCGAAYTIIMFGMKRACKGFMGVSILMLLTALINPTFSHQGVTELCELPGRNMLTLESIFFGIGAAFMLGATLLWFRIVSEILTADKIVYLFGRTFPVLGLLLSMILGFIPKVRRRYAEITMCRGQEQRILSLGRRKVRDVDNNGEKRKGGVHISSDAVNVRCDIKSLIIHRIEFVKHYIKNLSILVTWMLEDSVEMGKSMRGRGYGLPGRTQFTIYRFTKRDARMLAFIVLVGGYVIIGSVRGALSWYYYPVTYGAGLGAYSVSVYIAYALLCVQPVAGELLRNRQLIRGSV